MKTHINFNTEKLIKKINSREEFYEIKINGNRLDIAKKYNHKRGEVNRKKVGNEYIYFFPHLFKASFNSIWSLEYCFKEIDRFK